MRLSSIKIFTWCLLLLFTLVQRATGNIDNCPTPTATINGNVSVCFRNQPEIITATAGFEVDTWQWFKDGAPIPNGPTTNSISVSEPGVYFAYATPVTGACDNPERKQTNTVIIRPAPSQPTLVVSPSNIDVCSGEEFTFNVTNLSDADYTFDWDFGDGTVIARGGATVTHTYASSGTSSITPEVTVTAISRTGGCPSPAARRRISVLQQAEVTYTITGKDKDGEDFDQCLPEDEDPAEAEVRAIVAEPLLTRRDKARVVYFLEDRQANQIDGVVGFLPDPSRSGNKLLITGEANMNIRNIKGSGKQLGLQWRRVNRGSVILNGEYVHPNLFGTPFELGTRFSLLKQDSSFITVQPRVQLAYNTIRYGRFSVFTEWRNSRILASANPQSLRALDLADARTNTYGLNYLWNNLDDFYFPRKGRLVEMQVAAGRKKLLRNPGLERDFYDTLEMNTTQLSLALRLENFFRVGRNSALLARLRGETLLNDQIFLNDMYRIGGLATLRGFDEYFFFASTYGIGTLEYRLFTAEDSYVLLFYDQAYYRSDLETSQAEGMPLGVGGGISFSTGAGIFQLVYSVGRSAQQPMSLRTSKIHFGITSKF